MTPTKRAAPTSAATDAATHEAKRRALAAPGTHRRGDGFTEFEATGLLQLVRSRWREGWDALAVVHNQQHPGHNRSGDSLKKKFSRLYRAKLPPRGMKNHTVIALAHAVHREMRDSSASSVGDASTGSLDETTADTEMFSLPPTLQSESNTATPEVESSGDWEGSSVPALPPTAPTAPRPRAPRRNVTPAPVAPTSADGLLAAVLQTILHSQHQRDMDREDDRARREEERTRREEERRQWREAEERRRAEDREEQRRRDAARADERAEDQRRHEQLMQMMMLLVTKDAAGQQRGANQC